MIVKSKDVRISKIEKPRGGNGIMTGKNYLTNEELENNMTGFNMMELEAGGAIGYHQHLGDEEIYFILSGNGIIQDNGKEESIEAGDLIYTKAGEFHGLKNISESPLKFIAFIVKK